MFLTLPLQVWKRWISCAVAVLLSSHFNSRSPLKVSVCFDIAFVTWKLGTSLRLWSMQCIVDGHCRWGEHQRENQQEPSTILGSRSPNTKLLFFRPKTSVCLCPLFFILFLPKVSLMCNITLPLWENIYLFFMLYKIIFIMQSAFFPRVSLLCCWPLIQFLQVVFSSSVTNEPIPLSISISFSIWFVLSVALKRVL